MTTKVSFYIQAKQALGLGHLHRSINLIKKFANTGDSIDIFGEFDETAIEILFRNNFDILLAEPSDGVLIIDAVSINNDFKKKLLKYKKRFLVSPVFDDFKLPTHIFSRSKCIEGKKINYPNQKIIYDPDFSFSSINGLGLRDYINNQNITVGICISASADYFNTEDLLSTCLNSSNVESVKISGSKESPSRLINGKRVISKEFVNNVWDYFSNIDLFISGDGLMIFESMAQAIPTISLYRKDSWNKNKFFYEEEWCFSSDISEFTCKKIQSILSNAKILKKNREKLYEANFSLKENALYNSLNKNYID